jgi:PAS domain-containing protein
MGSGLELVAERAGGERFPVDVSLAPVPGGRGEVIAIVRDVTERYREEARLGYLAAIVQSCHDAVYSQDRNGDITAWNPAAQALFGYGAEEVLGWRSTRLFP